MRMDKQKISDQVLATTAPMNTNKKYTCDRALKHFSWAGGSMPLLVRAADRGLSLGPVPALAAGT